ncbi:MAG: hypothetical protein Q9167_004215 [Letrouitia subvulpina]
MSDVVASGAVFVPAIMPTGIKFSQITPTVAQQIAAVLNNFTSQGVEVWLRFAHEVNYYTTENSGGANGGPFYPGGTPAEFHTAWQTLHAAVASNPKILMFWSPNQNTTSEPIDGWWPGGNYVDIVGIDVYPDPGATFASAYGEFYNAYARGYNKHFCIGETGANQGGSVAAKEAWVKELANTDVSAYPCYKSATWFEYNKGVDFRIIQDSVQFCMIRITRLQQQQLRKEGGMTCGWICSSFSNSDQLLQMEQHTRRISVVHFIATGQPRHNDFRYERYTMVIFVVTFSGSAPFLIPEVGTAIPNPKFEAYAIYIKVVSNGNSIYNIDPLPLLAFEAKGSTGKDFVDIRKQLETWCDDVPGIDQGHPIWCVGARGQYARFWLYTATRAKRIGPNDNTTSRMVPVSVNTITQEVKLETENNKPDPPGVEYNYRDGGHAALAVAYMKAHEWAAGVPHSGGGQW